MDADDVGMSNLCGRSGFAQKLLGLGRAQLSLARNLYRDRAVEFAVMRLPDLAEGTDAKPLGQLEVRDRREFWR